MHKAIWILQCSFIAGVVLLCGSSWAAEVLPKGAALVGIEVQPAAVELKHRYDYRQVLVLGKLQSGETIDVTRMVQIESPEQHLTVSTSGVIRPKSDGFGEITFRLAGHTAALPVTVSGQKADYPVSFVRDVMPAMSKLGCNAGTCHGAQDGKNGFKLSLRGYDPLYDHRALTDDLAGRRFNRPAPDQSLMLLKTSGAVPHVGGVLMHPGEPAYELLRAWIAAGVQLDLDSPRVVGIEVSPKDPTIPLPGMKQQITVLAHYGDGSVRDVTLEAFVESSLAETVEVDKFGLATAVRRGEAAMLARYEGSYAATTITVMGDRSGFQWPDVAEHNYIDTLVYNKLKRVKILPADLCSDEEFLRRVYLDLTGLPPQPEELLAFVADARPARTKRDEVIDRLVGSPDFIEHWTNKWADLLQVNKKFLGEEGAWVFRNWIQHAIASNMPYDKFAQAVLTASGSTLNNPPASYYKVLRTPEDTMENTTQLFLAVRFNCNKCHDHPFERWTQDQYYQLSAYFAQVGRKDAPEFADRKIGGTAVEGAKALVEIIYNKDNGDVTHARTNVVTPPKFPYEHGDLLPPTAARREQLARWITSKENQHFAKSYVNRIWSYLLGVGIIDPVDDIRAGNPATNPELLERLTQEFLSSGFDAQQLFRTICRSRVYQHSIATNSWNEDDEINYSHAMARRLPAETLFNTVHRATGAPIQLPGVPAGFLATQLPDSSDKLPDDFLGLFGKPPRESACECERSGGVILGQALNLVNGPTVANAVAHPQNRIAKLVASEQDDRKVVEGIFLSILCRKPTEQEIATGVKSLNGANIAEECTALQAELAKFEEQQLPARFAAWLKTVKTKTEWTTLEVESAASLKGATLTRQPDGSVLASGINPPTDTYTLVAKTDLSGVTGIRLEVLADETLPSKGPGRAANGNLVLTEIRVKTATGGEEAKTLGLQAGTADFSQQGFSPTSAIDGKRNPKSGWAIAPQVGKSHVLMFETPETYQAGPGTTLSFTLDQEFGQQHTVGKLRLSVTNSARPIRADEKIELPQTIQAILALDAPQRTEAQQAELLTYFKSLDSELARWNQAIAALKQQESQSRLTGAQDLAWALLNTPAFLFNR